MNSIHLAQSCRSIFLILLITLTQARNTRAQYSDYSNQLDLLIFSGSDWCIPCIRFDKDVRQDSEFIQFADANLKIMVADFPQHKKLSREVITINEALAEKYNPEGVFPLVLLLDGAGNVLTTIRTNKVNARDIIDQIRPYLNSKNDLEFRRSAVLMGSAFHITLVTDKQNGEQLLDQCIQEIAHIESWLSGWQPGSITSEVNQKAGFEAVKVTADYYQLVARCLNISKLTQGAFDISFGRLDKLYTFDQQDHPLPANDLIMKAIQAIGYEKILLLADNRISFTDSLVKIGFGAIGKGYAAEQVKKLMIEKGVKGGVINASGDLTTWGSRADGEPWRVGIPNPENREEMIVWLPLADKAIATSGDYEKYFTSNGQRYSHIINPKTGLPVQGSRSVSVISTSAELSDALATAISVLGVDVGLDLVNQLDGVECVFIDNSSKLHFSNGLKAYEQ